MGGCQNYGPFLGTLNIRCRIIIGVQKGTIILATTHMTVTNSSSGSRVQHLLVNRSLMPIYAWRHNILRNLHTLETRFAVVVAASTSMNPKLQAECLHMNHAEATSSTLHNLIPTGGFSNIRATFLGVPITRLYSVLGAILGFPLFREMTTYTKLGSSSPDPYC